MSRRSSRRRALSPDVSRRASPTTPTAFRRSPSSCAARAGSAEREGRTGGVAVTLPQVMEMVHREQVEVGLRVARKLLENPAPPDGLDHRPVDRVVPGPHRLLPRDGRARSMPRK